MLQNDKQNNNTRHNNEIAPLIYAALDASSAGIIITDNRLPDNPIIYNNKAFERITGYTSDEIIGHNCRFLQAGERKQETREAIREAINKGIGITVEIRNYKKNGDLFWNELSISPLKNDDGEITHFIGVQNDISLRKNAEEKLMFERLQVEKRINERTENLRLNEEYFNSIIQTIRESLVVLDPDLNVLTVNESFLRTFKVTPSDTVGKQLFDLGNRQWDIDGLRILLETILPTNNPVLDFEVEHDFPHIGKKTMLLNAHRIELEGDYKDRILLAIEDVTDRRSIEKRKDDFLSIASHELKTPLTAIKGYIQLIRRLMPDDNKKLNDVVQKSVSQIERLDKLIVELLDVSKIQSGNLDIHHKNFDFDQMVRDTIEHVQFNSDDHTISLKGSTGVVYNGDETHLSQVVGNLVSNAIKYSPSQKQVHVYLSRLKGHIKFSITDSGVGIEQKDQKKVFDRFYRVGAVKEKFAGMGMGLYICEQIIKQHQGMIWVESELGEGSTFSFTLPIKEQQ